MSSEYQQQYYQSHKAEYRARGKAWKKANPEAALAIQRKSHNKHRSKRRAVSKQWFMKNFEKRLLAQARNSAKVKHLEFNLDLSDIHIPNRCPYLGIVLSREIFVGRIDERASIDRIDSSQGYIKGNVQVISNLANRMKNDATKEELITFAENILKIYGSSNV